jgi:hypothetical protein
MGHIAILVHKNGSFDNPQYLLREVAETWRENGWRISVLHGPQGKIAADLAILHVNMTTVPKDYIEYLAQFRIVLNGRVADISKRRISTNLVRLGDDYNGPVIVKANRNCGGEHEANLLAATTPFHRYELALRRRLPWGLRPYLKSSDYKVFSAANEVPHIVWLNPDLVVERFLSEMREGFYCLRMWKFLGDREINSLCYSKHPVVKSSNIVRRELVSDVPEELRQIRRAMGFDFGKFDYAIVDGQVVLYDTNWTPTMGVMPREQYLPQARHLAEGLDVFMERRTMQHGHSNTQVD